MKNIFQKISMMMLLAMPVFAYAENSKTQFGITVTTCSFDDNYDDENFCTKKKMQSFAKVMNERQPNFVNNLILYIYKSNDSVVRGINSSYRMVVINPRTHTAKPFYWAFNPVDKAVNAKGERLEFKFNTQKPEFCVKGNIEAYRNSYDYSSIENPNGFCFPYTGTGDHAGFEWFVL